MNYCTNCGEKVEEYYNVCPRCGTPLKNNHFASDDNQYRRSNSYSSTSDINEDKRKSSEGESSADTFAIVGFVLTFFIPIVGFILSILGMKSTKNKGFAIAGVILNSVIVLFTVIVIYFYISIIGAVIEGLGINFI